MAGGIVAVVVSIDYCCLFFGLDSAALGNVNKEVIMGLREISIGSIALLLLIVLLIFGTKRLRSVGEDLGNALEGFRKSVKGSDKDDREK